MAPEMVPVSSRTGSSMAAPAVLMANKVVAISAARFMFFLFVQASISEFPTAISLRPAGGIALDGRLHVEEDVFYMTRLVETDQALGERFDFVF